MIKCQACGQNPATVHLTEIVGGEKREKHLCEQCAAGEGLATGKTPVSLNEWLTNFVMQQGGTKASGSGNPVCEQCGMVFEEFRQGGLLGCPNCYEAFEEQLAPLLERAHENVTHHLGKMPAVVDQTKKKQYELMDLRRKLRAAVQSEDYEQAADLRDRIQDLENG